MTQQTTPAIGNAPVSYGAFEVTIGKNAHVPDAIELLDFVADAGYAGVDLGPIGYLGQGEELAERLQARGIGLTGGYVQIAFSEPETLKGQLLELEELLDVFDAVGSQERPPFPTVADAGSEQRELHPGKAATDRSFGLDDEGWKRFVDGVQQVHALCSGRGYDPAFHPHAGTFIEAGWEVDRLLELTDIGICFDPGHLLVGHVDPVPALKAWGDRVNHIHLKDGKQEILDRVMGAGEPTEAIYASGAFCPLGEGSVDIDGLLDVLKASGFAGWIVVEQDLVPTSKESVDNAAAQQRDNREYLRARGY